MTAPTTTTTVEPDLDVDSVDWASLQPPCEGKSSLAFRGKVFRMKCCENPATWIITVHCNKCGATYHSLRCSSDLNPNNCKDCGKGSAAYPAVVVVAKVPL